ncbi:hepatitis A virus cellular receptor 1 homolog%2C partial [Scomber scombrus]|uniref:Hepatitis A virus cellular receptor 1 homolog, partial n=1 Tax=Scomber scombrus TaxID=13677 RepID=A0AAV1Q7M1_SCOSC
MMTVRRFNSLLLLALLTVSGSNSTKVVGRAGEDVTLPCKYDFKSNGPTAVCWNQGSIPFSGCNDQIISTDGSKVTTRASSRYQLLGRLKDGDVSLTIRNTTKKDAGLYGCRVDIFGWFNDEKHDIDLTIEKAPSTSSTPTTETTEQTLQTEQTTNTSGQVTATESVPTSSNSIDPEPQQEDQDGGSVPVVLVCVLLLLIALVTAGVVVVIGRRWNQHKIPQQQQQQQQRTNTSVRFSSNSSALELHRRGTAVENIYQIDADGDGEGGGNNGGQIDVVFQTSERPIYLHPASVPRSIFLCGVQDHQKHLHPPIPAGSSGCFYHFMSICSEDQVAAAPVWYRTPTSWRQSVIPADGPLLLMSYLQDRVTSSPAQPTTFTLLDPLTEDRKTN